MERYIMFDFYKYEASGGFNDYTAECDKPTNFLLIDNVRFSLYDARKSDKVFQVFDTKYNKLYSIEFEYLTYSDMVSKIILCLQDLSKCDDIIDISNLDFNKKYFVSINQTYEELGGVSDIKLTTNNLNDIFNMPEFCVFRDEVCTSCYIEIFNKDTRQLCEIKPDKLNLKVRLEYIQSELNKLQTT